MLLNKVLYFVLALASTNILSQNAHTYCNVTCVSFQVQYFYNYCLIVFISQHTTRRRCFHSFGFLSQHFVSMQAFCQQGLAKKRLNNPLHFVSFPTQRNNINSFKKLSILISNKV